MTTRLTIAACLLLGAGLPCTTSAMGGDPVEEPAFTADFHLELAGMIVPDGGNRYCSLDPGRVLRLEAERGGDLIAVEITNLPQVRPVPFKSAGEEVVAITRVVEEREWVNGTLAEVSLNYYGRCTQTNNIYNFGEDVSIYENGEVVSREGSWLAGVHDAEPGLLMPSLFLLGARYMHGYAEGVSEDRAEHLEMGVEVITPAGLFDDCIIIEETTELEPEEECISIFAPGIGMIVDDDLELVEIRRVRTIDPMNN